MASSVPTRGRVTVSSADRVPQQPTQALARDGKNPEAAHAADCPRPARHTVVTRSSFPTGVRHAAITPVRRPRLDPAWSTGRSKTWASGARPTRSTRLVSQQLRRAFGRAYSIRDERGYGYFAGLHGLPLPSYCPHHTLLLPALAPRPALLLRARAPRPRTRCRPAVVGLDVAGVAPRRRPGRVPQDARAGQHQPVGDRPGPPCRHRPATASGTTPTTAGH